jgi:LPPG:FO 2-phospho-L-lactate transferase
MITALAGGVGAARFLTGLVNVVEEKDLTVVVNTGDDIDLYGLHISPDIDIVAYTLAGIVDEEKGWGIRDDTFNFLDSLKRFGFETWFNIGDKDLATHMFRTVSLSQGMLLSEVTSKICHALGLQLSILPMTDAKVETRITTKSGSMHFEEYFVKNGFADEILGVDFPGLSEVEPAEGVIDSIEKANLIVVCPSNPIVSIGTILGIKGVRDVLKKATGRKVAISPIIAGAPIKGPADKLLRCLGLEVSAFSVAKLYSDFLDTFIIDNADSAEKDRIESLGIEVKVANIIMKRLDDKLQLARVVME